MQSGLDEGFNRDFARRPRVCLKRGLFTPPLSFGLTPPDVFYYYLDVRDYALSRAVDRGRTMIGRLASIALFTDESGDDSGDVSGVITGARRGRRYAFIRAAGDGRPDH